MSFLWLLSVRRQCTTGGELENAFASGIPKSKERTVPVKMICPSCGKTLAAPDTAAGKKAKCPSCGQIMIVPEPVHEAEDVYASAPNPYASPEPEAAENWLNQLQPSATDAGDGQRQPCRECGEMIVVGAAKCRFCGAVFDPRLRRTSKHGGQSYHGFAVTSMVLGILALPTACFGIVLGIVAIVFAAIANNGMAKSRNYEGKGMATAGMIMGILAAVGWTIIYVIIIIVAVNTANVAHPHRRF
jgi:uncharacterized paraquat-inducible protein A